MMNTRKASIAGALCAFLVLPMLFGHNVLAGTLSCSVTTAAGCSGTVIYRMSGASNAHAELASQSTAAYANNVVCCTGPSGFGTACSGTFATVLKLSGTTNAHAEQNSQSNYANSVCLSAPSGGSVSIGYQTSNCTGFDTTLGSMSNTYSTTNAHVGDGSAYTTKICGTVAGASGTLTADIVDSGGTTVASPSVTFSAATFNFDSIQTPTGTLGVSAQKIRVSNTTGTAAWSLTIAATGGAGATWTSGGNTYPFNGATSANGQLTVDASGGTITPQGGCSTTGISLGSASTFSGGSNAPKSVSTASGSAQTNCYWDITGVTLSQTVPARQASGTYTISLTLTAA